MKIPDLARELKIGTKEILLALKEIKFQVKSINNTKLDPQKVTQVKQILQRKRHRQQSSEFPNLDKEIILDKASYSVHDVASLFGVSFAILLKAFLKKGMLLNLNSSLDNAAIENVAPLFNVKTQGYESTVTDDQTLKEAVLKIEEDALSEDLDKLQKRPPIVTIMGHVDHGKTKLLDTIRQSNVVDQESGAITQHIGAYQVKVKDDLITFLDTPGHEAFTSLRARGAQVTDIAVLVIAADEGLKPQSLEAIDHAKAADIPIVVAINKIDLPNADVEKCKQALCDVELTPEEWGGKTIVVPVSAKTNKGIDELLDMLQLLAETLELQAVYEAQGKAVVIESHLCSKRGPVVSVLVKSGQLIVGAPVAVADIKGKVRALINDRGEKVKRVTPGCPVEVLGLASVPEPGQILASFPNDKACIEAIEHYKTAAPKVQNKQSALSLSTISQQVEDGASQISVILKTDVHGSLEALKASIHQLSNEHVAIQLIHSGTGSVTPNDISLAQASQAFIFAFKVSIVPEAQRLAQNFKIQLKQYDVIYDILKDLEKVTKGLYKSTFVDVEVGKAEIRDLFHFSKVGSIAGCMVTEGKILRRGNIDVVRKGEILYRSPINALRRFKDDVKEVKKDFECGISLEKVNDLQVGDFLVCSIEEEQSPL